MTDESGSADSDRDSSTDGTDDIPEQFRIRQAKRQKLLDEGREPYPVEVARTHTLAEVVQGWEHLETGEETQDVVTVAGRVMFVRNTGKLAFAALQEGIGTRLQVMLSLAEVGEEALAMWKADVDLGDHVTVTGRVIRSRRGELSVMATSWELASKALRPLPVLHKELSEESRVRQRYADLVVRQEARDMVRTKAAALRAVRSTLDGEGFIEVETPVLQLVHGGAAARPFGTHMNAFSQDMSLRIALELNLKKAVVGGVDKVYEMGRIFRNEGVDSTHSPEFTMLEAYEAYGDQRTIGELTRRIYLAVADAIGSRVVETPQGSVDLDGEWRWLPVHTGLCDTPKRDWPTRRITVDSPDLMALVAMRGFGGPVVTSSDYTFAETVAFFACESVPRSRLVDLTGNRDYMLSVIFDGTPTSRVDAVMECAQAIGAELFASPVPERFVLRPIASLLEPSRWTVQAGVDLISLSETTDWSKVRNLWEVISERADSETVRGSYRQWDGPLRWDGPFGGRVGYFHTSLLADREQCETAAKGLFDRYVGARVSIDWQMLRNPLLEAGDRVTVMTERDAYEVVVDSFEVPLGGQHVTSASARTMTTEGIN